MRCNIRAQRFFLLGVIFVLLSAFASSQTAPTKTPLPTPSPTPALSPTPSVSPSTPPLLPPSVKSTPTIKKPLAVPEGYDAVLFDNFDEVWVSTEKDTWTQITKPINLKVTNEIRTGKGKVKILLRGRGELRLPPNSHIRIEEMSKDGSKVTIKLIKGRVWNKIVPDKARQIDFKVKTPDLVAGVRGTLFKAQTNRIAVFEGSVEMVSEKVPAASLKIPANTFSVIDQRGAISAPQPVDPEERKEWDEWDKWLLEIHEQISTRYYYGGVIIDAVAYQQAQDMKDYERLVREGREIDRLNREGERLDTIRDAMLAFAKDTGALPTAEQGIKTLFENPGIEGWKGPYLATEKYPVFDRWNQPIRYEHKTSRTGTVYGELISSGPNQQYEAGLGDDLKTIVRVK